MARSKSRAQSVESVREIKPKFSGRVLARLVEAEICEPDPWRRDDYRIAYLTVLFAARKHPQAHVEATYRVLGIHPDKVWKAVTERRKSLLGRWYESFYPEVVLENLPPKKPAGKEVCSYPKKQTAPKAVIPGAA